ncbi:NUDIX domain-containing protein [Metabacillus indicus]|uniref:NUDIX hydrolase n=1 Tax=Metabacillus indicus TaxID=246786 RepID=A0A084H272_METID|nr:NUDIX domain-containing protein [Metabacillus indicus]KEZ53684.1 NUDIX hydrolase [Metabacillus indicus]
MTYHMRVRAGGLIIEDDAILLVEFHDENGLHYNLPAGGVDPGESVKDAVRREVKEETSADAEVGPLAFVYEYAPHLNANKYGETHSIALMFECRLQKGSVPAMPANPDPNQTGVRWVKLADLDKVVLYPNLCGHIRSYLENKRNIELIEEQSLEDYDPAIMT